MHKLDLMTEVMLEVERQQTLGFDDSKNTHNDWVAYITSFAGRAGDTRRNTKEQCDFHRNMVKVAALAISALRAHDKGYC
jgi:hypothetical protein